MKQNKIENIDELVSKLSEMRSDVVEEKNKSDQKYKEKEKLIKARYKLLNLGIDYNLVEEVAPGVIESLIQETDFKKEYENRFEAIDIDPDRKIVAYLTRDKSTDMDKDHDTFNHEEVTLHIYKEGELIASPTYVCAGCFIHHVGYEGPGGYHDAPHLDFRTVEILETDDANILKIKMTPGTGAYEEASKYGRILTYDLEKNKFNKAESIDTTKYKPLEYKGNKWDY